MLNQSVNMNPQPADVVYYRGVRISYEPQGHKWHAVIEGEHVWNASLGEVKTIIDLVN